MPTAKQSIREIISSRPTAAAVLRRFDIDVCAQANETLADACAQSQLSVEQLLEKLEEGDNDAGATADPAEFAPGRLIQHIVRIHHKDLRQELPRLVELAHTVAEQYADRAREVKRVERLVSDLHADMSEHIVKEEQLLFPYIAQLGETPLLAFRPPHPAFTKVGQPVFVMAQEHERAKVLVAELREATDFFKPPVWACSTMVALYAGLRSFADTFTEHIRLEDEVLFPRAIAMEEELMRGGVQ